MIRVRMAPSPTGLLHIGTARTTLFNYLFAKKNGAKFVLRIEDTDVERSSKAYEEDIISGLKWLGIEWDEGPDIGGEYGPYRQRERLDIYKKYLNILKDKGLIYPCYCTQKELDDERETQQIAKQPPKYSGRCRHLTADQITEFEKEGRVPTWRFKVEAKKLIISDMVKGEIEFDTGLIGDIIIAKDFDLPLYNFAVVIDDYEMKISHVIRGDDHVSNTPKQIMIAQALDFPIPEFGHLPMILNKDRTKLSKRKNKVSLTDYKNEGYLPECIVNFMVLLGWNPGTEKEIFSLNELEGEFDITRVNKAGAIFDTEKLDWMNGFYIRNKEISQLTHLCLPYFEQAGFIKRGENGIIINNISNEEIELSKMNQIVDLLRDRLKKLSEITNDCGYFFNNDISFEKGLLAWKEMTVEKAKENLVIAAKVIESISDDDFTKEKIENELKRVISEKGLSNGELLWPFRVSLTGLKNSCPPFEVGEILGKELVLSRIKKAINL